MTKRHSHAYAIWVGYRDTPLTARETHRYTHRHPFEDPVHRHQFVNTITDPARYYDEERTLLAKGGRNARR